MKKTVFIIILTCLVFCVNISYSQRFPKPEFETDYIQPKITAPSPRSIFMQYLDLVIFAGALSLSAWLVLKKRSRRGIIYLSMFSVIYFGFVREGCICPVGSIQNVVLAIFNSGYTIPLTVIIFFILPLLFALFYGRTFCAAVCPLGAIQDLVIFKPVKVPFYIAKVLSTLPYIYLVLAILYSATNTDFIICRFDPFVGFFRFNAEFDMFIFGGLLLAIGVFIARPYCRFLCPYGVLLKLVSPLAKKHITISPSNCIQCKLCENSCPFDAIRIPNNQRPDEEKKTGVLRLLLITALIPVFVAIGVFLGSILYLPLARVNQEIQLTEEVLNDRQGIENSESDEIVTFKASGQPIEQLVESANSKLSDFKTYSMILGGVLGLLLSLALLKSSIIRQRTDYQPDKGNCLSCGRCIDYCPIKK